MGIVATNIEDILVFIIVQVFSFIIVSVHGLDSFRLPRKYPRTMGTYCERLVVGTAFVTHLPVFVFLKIMKFILEVMQKIMVIEIKKGQDE